MLTLRLDEFNDKGVKNDLPRSNSSKILSNAHKAVIFSCDCTYQIRNLDESVDENLNESKSAKLSLYNYNLTNEKSSNSNSLHELFLDLVDSNDESRVYLTTYLKLVKIFNQHKTLEFDIDNSVIQNNTDKSNYRVSELVDTISFIFY